MSRQYKNGKCSCWNSVNKNLKEHNTQLKHPLSFSGHTYVCVETEKVDESVRNRPKMLIASHCPFCGVKLHEQS